MKKLLCTLLALICALSLFAACGTDKTPPSNEQPAANEPAADPAAPSVDSEKPTYQLKLGHYFSAAQGGGELAQLIADKIAEKSDGRIQITVYSDSLMGNQTELSESVRLGTIDMCLCDWGTMNTNSGYAKGALVGLPFMFKGWEHITAFNKSDIMATMTAELKERYGILCLGNCGDGFRKVYSQTPLNSLSDYEGLKIRVPDIAVYVDTFTALGCAPTIVSAAELYTSLQSGIVNALERPADGMYSNNLYEQTSYISPTDHIWGDINCYMNSDILDAMDEEARQCHQRGGA